MQTTTVTKQGRTYEVVEVPSSRNPSKVYRVDVTNARCSCPAWVFQSSPRVPCKHLVALGAGIPEWVTAPDTKAAAAVPANKDYEVSL